ncbi:MAG: AAA family ATPase [Thermodesulfovibrionales bacterium]
MYLEHFGLKEIPFSIVPDPHYLYMSKGHREALAHLRYGINNNAGFVMLTGEVGAGKTTICRSLLKQMPQDIETAFILNPRLTVEELLASVCDEFRIDYPKGNTSVKVFVDGINEYLLSVHRSGRRAVLIIEEAQNLSPGVLEQLRLLTNLETDRRKLLQIILLGQPELRDMLDRPELRQLAQRITARYHLGPLSSGELDAYIAHRIAVAGCDGRLFPSSLMPKLFYLSNGIPRVINVICDRALLGACVEGQCVVSRNTMIRAAAEVSGEGDGRQGWRRGWRMSRWITAGLVLVICGILLSSGYYHFKAASVAEEKAGTASPGNSSPVDLRWRPAKFFPLLQRQNPYNSASANDRESDAVWAGPSVRPGDREGQRGPASSGENIAAAKAGGDGSELQSAAAEKSIKDGREKENVVHP